MNEVQIRHVPERKLLTVTGRVHQWELDAFLRRSTATLADVLDSAHVNRETNALAIYKGSVSQTADGPIEICMPFHGNIDPPEGMQVRVDPDHQEVFTTLTKAESEYPRVLDAHNGLVEYLRGNNFREAGPPREVYVAGADWIGPEECFVELARPITALPALAGVPQFNWPGE